MRLSILAGHAMANKKVSSPERLAAFSDGVFAMMITIMVLDLKPPPQYTFEALAEIWPMLLDYAVSYFFIAIVWLNHHHPIRFASLKRRRKDWCGAIYSSPSSVVRSACHGICIDLRFRGRSKLCVPARSLSGGCGYCCTPGKAICGVEAIITLSVLRSLQLLHLKVSATAFRMIA